MKKKIILTLTLIILLTIMTPIIAIGAEDEPGTIEISTVLPNSFDGQTLSAYQIFHMKGDSTAGWYYEIHDDFTSFDYDGKTGFDLIEYIYSLEDEAALHGASMRSFTEALADFIKTNDIQRTGFTEVPARIHLWDQMGEDPDNPGSWIVINPTCPPVLNAKITGLPPGYYFVLGTVQKPIAVEGHSTGSASIAPFMALASTDNPQQPLLINPKASAPVIVKRILSPTAPGNLATVGIGDEVKLQVETQIPLNVSAFDHYTFNIHVSLKNFVIDSCFFDFEPNKLLVFTEDNHDTILPNANTYTIHKPPLIEGFLNNTDNRFEPVSFSVEFTQEFIKENTGKKVYIEFPVIYNDNATYRISRFLLNQNQATHMTHAALEYSDNPLDSGSKAFIYDRVSFVTSTLSLYKFTGDINSSHRALTGATGVRFGISKESNLQTGAYVDESELLVFKKVIHPGISTLNGINFFYTSVPRYVLALDQQSPLTGNRVKHLQPDEHGKIYILGLGYDTFYLYETNAPDGYGQLTAPKEISIARTGGQWWTQQTVVGANTVVHNLDSFMRTSQNGNDEWTVIAIQNNRTSMFPETGGIGTGIFLLIGSVIMVVSVIALIIIRKSNKKNK